MHEFKSFVEWVVDGLLHEDFPSMETIFEPSLAAEFLTDDLFEDMVYGDTFLALFSMLFVLAYFIFHLRSLFLGIMSMIIIVLSFPLTALICEGVFGVGHFGQMHMLICFLVLGIGADDVFVLIDAWR